MIAGQQPPVNVLLLNFLIMKEQNLLMVRYGGTAGIRAKWDTL